MDSDLEAKNFTESEPNYQFTFSSYAEPLYILNVYNVKSTSYPSPTRIHHIRIFHVNMAAECPSPFSYRGGDILVLFVCDDL